jgi:hypothetical protein
MTVDACGCQADNASRKTSLRLVTSSRDDEDPCKTTVSFFICTRCQRRWRNEWAWRYPVDDDDYWEDVTGKREYDSYFNVERD